MEYMLYRDFKTSLLARRHLVNERNRWGHVMEYMLYEASRPTCWPAAILSTRGKGGVMEYMLYGDLKSSLLARRHLVNERNRWGHGMEYMLYGDLKTYLLARRHLVSEKYMCVMKYIM
jgi:hypothetical protein